MRTRYWRGVRRQARKETREALFGSAQRALIDAVGWALWLGVVFLVLKTTELQNELLIGIIAGAAPALLYPVLYLFNLRKVPPRLREKDRKREKRATDRISELEKTPETDMRLTLRDGPVHAAGDRDSAGNDLPPVMVFLVNVENIGQTILRECQLKFGLDQRHAYPASKAFDLRRGENRDLPILRIQRNVDDPRAFLYFLDPRTWEISENGGSWLTAPGRYQITAFSADSAPAYMNAELSADLSAGRFSNWRLARCL